MEKAYLFAIFCNSCKSLLFGPIFLLFLFSVLIFPVFSQTSEKMVSGIVHNELGQPVTGVTISIKGSKIGADLNENGLFNVEVPGLSKNSKLRRIDFIWINPTVAETVVSSDIIHDKYTDNLSDHYPVIVEFQHSNIK